jgi:hypothetical protein
MSDKPPVEIAKALRAAARVANFDEVRELLEPHMDEIVERLVGMAKSGDASAMRLVVERLSPALKADGERVFIPELAEAKTIEGKAEAILNAVADGRVSAEAAAKLMSALEAYGRAVSVSEIEQRIAELEASRDAPRLTRRPGGTYEPDGSESVW